MLALGRKGWGSKSHDQRYAGGGKVTLGMRSDPTVVLHQAPGALHHGDLLYLPHCPYLSAYHRSAAVFFSLHSSSLSSRLLILITLMTGLWQFCQTSTWKVYFFPSCYQYFVGRYFETMFHFSLNFQCIHRYGLMAYCLIWRVNNLLISLLILMLKLPQIWPVEAFSSRSF